jgi:hypothetical protein
MDIWEVVLRVCVGSMWISIAAGSGLVGTEKKPLSSIKGEGLISCVCQNLTNDSASS